MALEEYIKETLSTRLVDIYKINPQELKNILENYPIISKKFDKLCKNMPSDKDTFDRYIAQGLKDIKGLNYTYEIAKDLCKSLYNLIICCKNRKYSKNIDSELKSFEPLIKNGIDRRISYNTM